MTNSRRFPALASAALLALALPGCTHAQEADVANAPVAQPPAVAAAEADGPALWKVADADTTIYLFGTVHALPEDVEWYQGPIATALGGADVLVTEIPGGAATDPAMQQMIGTMATLPEGQTLRDLLNDEQRTTYEAALVRLGLPPAAFDRFEPWFAGMTLAVLPLMQQGWDPAAGVEQVIETKIAEDVERDALETVEFQMSVFDTLPQESQVEFLVTTARDIDRIVPMMDKMVAEWLEGDADQLAELMNQSLTDEVLAEALLYARNRNWAQWIDTRLDQPGTVFVAVGAGHLAGDQSVQDYLSERGLATTRVQ